MVLNLIGFYSYDSFRLSNLYQLSKCKPIRFFPLFNLFLYNMKELLPLIFLVFFTSILVSCEEEDFSTVAEVDLSEYGNEIVVLAPFSPDIGDREWHRFYLILMKSNDILDQSEKFERVNGAVVDFFEEGEYQFSLDNYNDNGLYTSPEATGIQSGKNYQIEIHSDEYGKITASSYIPKKVNVLKAYISDENYYDVSEGIEKIELTLDIEDEANVENFYFLTLRTVARTDTSNHQSYPEFTFNDPIFDDGGFSEEFLEIEEFINPQAQYDRSLTFRDELFDGQQKSLKVYIPKSALQGYIFDDEANVFIPVEQQPYFIIGAMSRELYLYKRSAIAQSRISENPFAEAVRVYNNIEGGVGIFGGLVQDTVFVE